MCRRFLVFQPRFILGPVFPPWSSLMVGVIYPAYASVKAVDKLRSTRQTPEAEKWLTYWATLAALTGAEQILSRALNWYGRC